MARFGPAQSVANQIRGKIGVNMGGARGRSATVHKGVGLNQNSGGLNARGSGKQPGPQPRNPVGLIGMQANSTARPIGAPPVRPAVPARPSEGPRLPGSMGGTARPPKRPGKPLAGAPAAPPAPASVAPAAPVVPTNPLDYRSQSGYITSMADLDYEAAAQRRDLQGQLAENARLYDSNVRDAKTGYASAVESGEDQLSHGNLLRSGARETSEADRFKEFDTHLSGIEQQYGSVASARLNQALEELKAWEAMQRQGIEGSAKDAWGEMYPASPIEEPVEPVAPVAGPAGKPVAKPKPKPKRVTGRTYTDGRGRLRVVGTGALVGGRGAVSNRPIA